MAIQTAQIKVAVAVPAMETVRTMFMYDIARMMAYTASLRPDIKLQVMVSQGSLIMKQRQSLAQAALLDPETTHIMWLDSDMRFPKDTLIRLLAHNVQVVMGAYTERKPPFKPAVFTDAKDFTQRAWSLPDSTGLKQVIASGFGCVLTEVDVFKKMKKPWFHVGWNREAEMFLGEDIYFFLQLNGLGIPAWLDQDLTKEIAHVGDFEFTPHHALQAEMQRVKEAADAAEAKPE